MDESQSEDARPRHARERTPGREVRPARGAPEWLGWALAATGAVLCVLGWYGVSGEAFVEQQIPYLASSTIPGAALVVAGTVMVAVRTSGRSKSSPPQGDPTDLRIERLYALLVEPADPAEAGAADEAAGRTAPNAGAAAGPGHPDRPDPPPRAAARLALPEGTLYHRPDCPLIAGKPRAEPVGAAAVRSRGLTACGVCEPPRPGDPTPAGESAPPNG
ncbi:hypothetical protein ACFVVX_19270 [Kitasatospora sp. NPDC058170]|uniref:hypothetical protein n=1 Tax=Kitasatospora sp. NPDC058170 TaxID=3346364 RepID=UPI0036DDDC73